MNNLFNGKNHFIIIVVIIIVLYTGCKNKAQMQHRTSEDKSEEILYLFDNIALHRKFWDYAITENGIGSKNIFNLVKAHWKDYPTLISFTGDEIDEIMVEDIKKLNIWENKVIYGIANTKSTNDNNTYFVITNKSKKILKFQSPKLFVEYLKALKITRLEYLKPEVLIREYAAAQRCQNIEEE